jgi:ribosomal protein L29
MKAKELAGLETSDLNAKLEELNKELIKLNAQVATGTSPKSPGMIKNARKTIAKIYTILNQKEKSKNQRGKAKA